MFPLPAGELFFAGSLPEKRLRERAVLLLQATLERPGAAMTSAFDEPNPTRNAYNFFQNDRLSLPVLLDPPTRALRLALREQSEMTTVLSVQDTSELNLSHLQAMQGLGTLGNPRNHGLMLHAALAVDTDGVPLGLLHAQTWARPEHERGKAQTRRKRAFEDKESARWWTTVAQIEQTVDRPGLLLHVGDSESDIFALFTAARAAGYRLLVRASRDRCVEGEQGYLWAHVETFAEQPTRYLIHVSARPASKNKPARAAREATVALRVGQVVLRAPHGGKGAVPMWAVLVRELDAPEGAEPIEWLLLTSDPIQTEAEAWTRVDWYTYRWVIEEYFKVLKTGCRVEARQFKSREPYEVALGFSLLAAVTLLALTKRARVAPDLPARAVLSADEEHVLKLKAEAHGRRLAAPLTVQDAVVRIAMLGGYLNRSCDGPPGWITLWRGYQRLYALVEGYRLAHTTLPG